jgi:hypothetical protein
MVVGSLGLSIHSVVGPSLPLGAVLVALRCEAFGLVAEEEAVDESLDELSVLVCEACGEAQRLARRRKRAYLR